MSDAASASTGSDPACARGRVVRSSGAAVPKVGGDSPRRGRRYVSLRRRDAFRRVYRSKRRHRHGDVVVLIAEGDPGPPQVGFVTGKRIGNAVERNRVKRRLREAMGRVVLDDDTAYLVIAEPGEPGLGAVDFGRIVEWLGAAVASGRDDPEDRA